MGSPTSRRNPSGIANTGMTVRQAAIKCAEDGFTVQVPDDADADIRASVARVRENYRTGDDGRVLVRQRAQASDGRSTARTGSNCASVSCATWQANGPAAPVRLRA